MVELVLHTSRDPGARVHVVLHQLVDARLVLRAQHCVRLILRSLELTQPLRLCCLHCHTRRLTLLKRRLTLLKCAQRRLFGRAQPIRLSEGRLARHLELAA